MTQAQRTILQRWLTLSPIDWVVKVLSRRAHELGMPAGYSTHEAHRAAIEQYAKRVLDFHAWDENNASPLARLSHEIKRFAKDLPPYGSGVTCPEQRTAQWEEAWLRTLRTVKRAFLRESAGKTYAFLPADLASALARVTLHLIDPMNQKHSSRELSTFHRHIIKTTNQSLRLFVDPSDFGVSEQSAWNAFQVYKGEAEAFERAKQLMAQWASQTQTASQNARPKPVNVSATEVDPAALSAPRARF